MEEWEASGDAKNHTGVSTQSRRHAAAVNNLALDIDADSWLWQATLPHIPWSCRVCTLQKQSWPHVLSKEQENTASCQPRTGLWEIPEPHQTCRIPVSLYHHCGPGSKTQTHSLSALSSLSCYTQCWPWICSSLSCHSAGTTSATVVPPNTSLRWSIICSDCNQRLCII